MANYKKLGLVKKGLRKLNVEKSRLVQLPAQILSFFCIRASFKARRHIHFGIYLPAVKLNLIHFNGYPESQVQPSRTSFSRKKWPRTFYHIFATFSPIGDGHPSNVLSYIIKGLFSPYTAFEVKLMCLQSFQLPPSVILGPYHEWARSNKSGINWS